MICEKEEKLQKDSGWKIKVMEQAGTPLLTRFASKFPIIQGCPRKKICNMCDQDGVKCSAKGMVYKAFCVPCKAKRNLDSDGSKGSNKYVYIGETSRQFGERVSKTKQRITPRSHLSSLDEGAQHRDGGTGFQVYNYQRP